MFPYRKCTAVFFTSEHHLGGWCHTAHRNNLRFTVTPTASFTSWLHHRLTSWYQWNRFSQSRLNNSRLSCINISVHVCTVGSKYSQHSWLCSTGREKYIFLRGVPAITRKDSFHYQMWLKQPVHITHRHKHAGLQINLKSSVTFESLGAFFFFLPKLQ